MKKNETIANLKTETGFCKYCKQGRAVQIGEDQIYSQADLDNIASSECTCDGARHAQEKENRIRRAKDAIDKITVDGEKEVGDFLKSALSLLADHKIKKLSVNINGIVTYTVLRGNEEQLSMQRRETITEGDEIE
ncbi:MAG: hypothetical protein K5886_02695 [Lachnospiraceae bacterium]|nr:hypothetical protein [Lachnospiraceae bacterium]